MRVATFLTMIALPLALAACSGGEEATRTEDMPMSGNMPNDMPMSGNMPNDMPMMGSGTEMRMAKAEGTVTAIDNQAGTITIEHGPVPAVEWPAMTMAFTADEALRSKVAVGDEVTFDFQTGEAGSRIAAISKK